MKKFCTKVTSFFVRKNEGATIAEYALLLSLIAAVCVIAIGLLGGKISDLYVPIGDALK